MITKTLLCAVTICGAAATLAQTPPAPRLPNNAAILTGAAARPLFNQCSRASPVAAGYWTPKSVDIQTAERSLFAFLPEEKGVAPYKRRLRNDYRQYAGFTAKNGHKCLYLNGFSPDVKTSMERAKGPGRKPFNWKAEAVMVCDGGDSFWGAEYDTQTGKWSHLSFNGPY